MSTTESDIGPGPHPPFLYDTPPTATPAPPPPAAPAPPPPPVEDNPAGPRPRRWRAPVAVLAVLLVAACGFVAGRALDGDSPAASPVSSASTKTPAETPTTASGPVAGNDGEEPVAAVAAAVAPAVVQLETGSGLGSGVIFDHEGHVLTAAHVVGNANSVKVRLADGTVLDGDVVGADPATDVAVVQIQGQDAVADLPAATLATGVKLEVGQVAVAIGSPFGLDQTVTAGVVSAVNRAVPTDGGSALGMIQTDAPINPGNSGGALADRHGRVIGINDAIRSESGGNVGVGFAIPIDTAADVAKQLIAGEPLQTAFLGVTTTDQTGGTRAGALIAGVESGSPADDAGLQQGDLVVAVNGSPVEGSTDLVAAVRSSHPGDQVTLTIVRDGQERQLDVTLGQLQQ